MRVFLNGCTARVRCGSQAAGHTEDIHTHTTCRLRGLTLGVMKRTRISQAGLEVGAGPGKSNLLPGHSWLCEFQTVRSLAGLETWTFFFFFSAAIPAPP